jgi:hypothetical protein
MVRLSTPRYVNPNPVIITCARCPFTVEAPVEEAHAAFAAHSCVQVVAERLSVFETWVWQETAGRRARRTSLRW